MPTESPSSADSVLRLENIEIKLAFAEELLDTLNMTVAEQAKQIEALGREVLQLRKRQDNTDQASGRSSFDPTDESPPHY